MLKIAKNLELPLDFVTERIAFLARTGAGKSGGMRVLFEQALDAKQFVIFIDPKGDAWGIRAAGTGKGRPVLVMGGDHADVPLEPTAGKFIAEFLVRERVSTVLDISEFTTKDMWRFVGEFATTLYRKNRDVVLVMIDEADMVAGEKYFDPHTLHGIQLIQNKGRHRGFGVVVATQRSAMLNKTVLFASGTLVAMQTTGPRDIEAIKDWLKYAGTKEATELILSGLPTLQNREAFVYSPQTLGPEPIRIKFNSFTTFDSMRTPKPGETRQSPKSIADIDLSAVKRDMAATIEKVNAEDPKKLQAEVRRLNAELLKRPIAQLETKIETQTIEVFPKGLDGKLGTRIGTIANAISAIEKNCQDVRSLVDQALTIIIEAAKSEPKALAAVAGSSRPNILPPPVKSTVPKLQPVDLNGDAQLSKAERLILRALFWLRDDRNITAAKIGFYSGYSHKSGSFSNALSSLRTKGMLNGYEITSEGAAIASTYADVRPTGAELREWLRPKLNKCENELLDVMVANPGVRFDNKTLAESTPTSYSHESGSFSNALSRLRSLDAAEGYGREGVKASDVFFEA